MILINLELVEASNRVRRYITCFFIIYIVLNNEVLAYNIKSKGEVVAQNKR